MTDNDAKNWNRRLAIGSGAAAVLGLGYLALHRSTGAPVQHALPPRGTYNRGNAAEPDALDPALGQGVQEDAIVGDLMEGLIAQDPMGKPIPGIATHWETSPDGLIWTFHLRQSLWSDGTPLTAEDFVFAWRRAVDPATAAIYAYFLYDVKNALPINTGKLPITALGARAVDPLTFEVTLEHPVPYLLEMLPHMTMYPVPRHVVMAKGKAWATPGNYVSNGAFILTEWVPNEHITVVKNPLYHDAKNVALERIIYYPTDDYGAALQRMRAGGLDTQDRLPNEQIDWIRKNMSELLDPVPQLIMDCLSVNLTHKPFDDIRVRKAMNLAINREALTDRVTRVGYVPAYSLVPPNTANYPGGQALDVKNVPVGDRLKMGQDLMRQAGFGPDKRVRCNYMIRATTAGSYRSVAAAIQQMLSLVYVDVSIVPNDMAMFYNTIQVHDYEMSQPGWQADFDDASNFLDLFHTDNGNNWGKYSNPAYDALMDSAKSDTDIVSRGKKMAAAEAVLLKDQAFIPLFFWVSGNLVRPYVKGWQGNNMDYHRSRWISIDEDARAKLLSDPHTT